MCLLLPATVLAEPETRFNKFFYMVTGNTAKAIWADILAKSPVRENGKQHVAYTRWHVNWQFWWSDNGGTCKISEVTTKLEVTYTLPRLKPDSARPDSVTAHWQEYYAALFEHEQGHKDLGVRATNELQDKIANMGPRRNCKLLELDANKIGKRVIDTYSQLEKEYDRTTNHGLNTGAVFP